MKKFIKIFSICLISFGLVFAVTAKLYVDWFVEGNPPWHNDNPVVKIPAPDPQPQPQPDPKPDPAPEPAPDPAPAPEPTPANPWAFENPLNILLIGLDDVRADTIMVASLNPESKKVNLISIPRDTYYPRSGYSDPTHKKINATHVVAGEDSDKSQSVINAVEDVLAIKIDYYIKIDMSSAKTVINLLGGVDVNINGTVKNLEDQQAMNYLQNRNYHSGDLARIKVHHDFVIQAFKKSLSFTDIMEVAAIITKNTKTNIDSDTMKALADLAKTIDPSNIEGYTIPGEVKYMDNLSYFIRDEVKTKEEVKELLGDI